ncbi:MAG: M55 family metallopeptidase [Vampirovibrionales bacterium]|nr:M55 family metallopeptidase [Vampirovibrionales bacterium]
MKLYISADLEGVCGVSSKAQCYPQLAGAGNILPAYTLATQALAAELRAVLRGLASGGSPEANLEATLEATQHTPHAEPLDVLINDAHGPMVNLHPQQLLPSAPEGDDAFEAHWPSVQLLSGKPKLCAMMAGLNEDYSAAMFVGYHSKAGTQCGVLAHSFVDWLTDITLNGRSVGEAWLNALYAHALGVPVLLGSGDQAFCDELRELLPEVLTVSTKTGQGWAAAIHQNPADVQQELAAQAAMALDELHSGVPQAPPSWLPEAPYILRLSLSHPVAADLICQQPHWQRVNGLTVETRQGSYLTTYQALQGAYACLGATQNIAQVF